jgi:antitoxin (DNA-binding transcriptional repressor) of toxin-antitoxin stability system
MRTVNIAELKNRLSTYIAYAKAGETIIIRDRNTAVAQLTPLPVDDDLTDEERELVAAGLIRLPEKPWNIEAFDHLPLADVDGNALTQAILDEREEGR